MLVLASQSPRRQQLVREAGLPYRVIVPQFDEEAFKQEALSPADLVCELARGKAGAARSLADIDDYVVGCDTVVALDGNVLGKPKDPDDARRMLRTLSGRTHVVETGTCILHGADERVFCVTSKVTFFDLSDREIDGYVASGEPLDKAGSYGVQGKGRLIVSHIDGDFFSVMGLPIARLVRELRALGFAC